MKYDFGTILERDMDLLMLNAFGTDESFVKLFIDKTNLPKAKYKVKEVYLSKSDKDGESDITVIIESAGIKYDYFKQLFKKSVTNEYVHNEWLNAEYALSQALTDSESVVLKTLALINIVNKPGELPANEKTLMLAAGAASNTSDSIASLEERGIIYKKASDNTFAFKTKATADVRNELTKRKNYRINTVG